MKKVAFYSLSIILCLILAAFWGCGKKADDGTVVLKLAHGLNTAHPVHKAMEFMAEKVKEKSGGKMRVDIYPSEQLGSERECIEQLQLGGLAMTKTSSAVLENFVEKMKVFSLPYIFRDTEHYWKVLLGPVGKELLASSEPFGVKGLCYYDAGARSYYCTKKAINSPADLAGVKVRVQKSNLAIEMVKAMGGSPTAIDWGELYTSLQQGVVDAAENNPVSFYTSRHYDICKHYNLDEHTMPPDVLQISTVAWKKLSPEQQAILQEAADESVTYQRKLWIEEELAALDAVAKAGVAVTRPDKAPFREAVKPMLAGYDGTEIGELAKKIEEVQ